MREILRERYNEREGEIRREREKERESKYNKYIYSAVAFKDSMIIITEAIIAIKS